LQNEKELDMINPSPFMLNLRF